MAAERLPPRSKEAEFGRSLVDAVMRRHAERYVTRWSSDLHEGLARAMRSLTKRYLRRLGLVAFVLDFRSARWLKELARDLPSTRSDGTPWPEGLRDFAHHFANEAQCEQNRHPLRWGEKQPFAGFDPESR